MCGSALITERAAVWRTDNVAQEPLSGIIVFVALILPVMPGRAAAAPVAGEIFPLRQPDGSTIEVRVWGDEFHRVVESLDGYTLVRDPERGAGCYARLSPDGNELVSTGISVGSAMRATLDLKPHLRIDPASARAKIAEVRAGQSPRLGVGSSSNYL